MVVASHTHKFEIDNRSCGVCACGEVRQYIEGRKLSDNSYEILHAGDPNYLDRKRGRPRKVVECTSVIPSVPSGNSHQPSDEVPARPPELRDLFKYFDENKDAILADIKRLGKVDGLKHWHISQATYYRILCKRWHVDTRVWKRSYMNEKEEVIYLRGWKDCAEKFMEVLGPMAIALQIGHKTKP